MGPRVLVFAYSETGYACLDFLIQAKANIVGVFSHVDDPKENRWYRSVPDLAKKNEIKLFQPHTPNTEEWYKLIKELKPDLILSFYYRNMIASRILDLAPLGAFNMHGSLLPKYRGRVPINWAILNGEIHTGATLHVMVKQADAGDIIDQEVVEISNEDNALIVSHKVRDAAVIILKRQLPQLLNNTTKRIPQDHTQATLFSGRKPEDGRIDWTQPAKNIYNLIRAVTQPFPGAFMDTHEERWILWKSRIDSSCPPGIQPGTIISTHPLKIAASDNILEILEYTRLPLNKNT